VNAGVQTSSTRGSRPRIFAKRLALNAAVRSLLIVGLGTSVVPLDSAVNIGFPAIVGHFGLAIPMIQWVVIAYVLMQTSLMLSFGRIGDMLGYRRIFLFGTGISAAAFVACALAPSFAALLAARIVQGIGAGLILSCGPALATSLFPEAMRSRILSHYMLMFGIGWALGPSVFGLLVDRFGWSAVFSFRAPIALAAFMLGFTLPRRPRSPPEPFDAAGGALLALALSCLLLALNRLRAPGPDTGLFAAVAITGFALFYRQERRFVRPIIDFDHFRNGDFTAINVMNALINLAAFSIMLLAPFYLSRLPGLSLAAAGLVLAVSPLGVVLAAPVAGIPGAVCRPRTIALLGCALCSVGLFGISLSGEAAEIPMLVLSMAIQGFGLGLFQVAYFDIVTATMPAHDRGVAGALGMATRTVGTVMGATVLMLVFQSLRGSGADGETFLPAFRTTFRIAASIPAALILLDLWRER
jgi:MFS family permease